MRVALYARVSTLKHCQSPEMQLRELRQYCQRRSWEISAEYVDNGISGAKDVCRFLQPSTRPALAPASLTVAPVLSGCG
jgi:DNA invertase Pin-like site-specific DNA recombinase